MSAFVHMELSTSDVPKAKKFYKSVLGWTYQEMPMPEGTYTLVMSESGPVGGMQKNPMPKAPNSWCGYASVRSVARTVTKVKKLGGKVIVPKTDLPSGSLAVLTDPQGATFGVWQAASPAKPAKKATKKAAKKRTTKKAAKKATKKAAKKRTTKKAAKKATKKAAKKRTTKKAAKKATKKAAKKRTTKKAAKKRAAKKK